MLFGFLLLCLVVCIISSPLAPCDSTDICIISNRNIVLHNPNTYELKHTHIVFRNTIVTVNMNNNDLAPYKVAMFADSIEFFNSSIFVSEISIETQNITVDFTSLLSTDGLGFKPPDKWSHTDERGGDHCGCGGDIASRTDTTCGNEDLLALSHGGSGSSSPSDIYYGGGIISISAFNLSLEGALYSRGQSAYTGSQIHGAGAGGTIFLDADYCIGSGYIDTSGGSSNSAGGGGGGKIILENNPCDSIFIKNSGGLSGIHSDKWLNGGAGLTVIQKSDNYLISCYNDNPSLASSRTVLGFSLHLYNIYSISFVQCAAFFSCNELNIMDSFSATSSDIKFGLSQKSFFFNVSTFRVHSSTLTYFSEDFMLYASYITIDKTSTITTKSFFVASENFLMEGQINAKSSYRLNIHSIDLELKGTISTGLIRLFGNSIKLSGQITASNFMDCGIMPHFFPSSNPRNYSLFAKADYFLGVSSKATVSGSSIMLSGETISIDGIVSASELGCGPESGIGGGFSGDDCASGGGYISIGGFSVAKSSCSGGIDYFVNSTLVPGSGGGSSTFGGSGGGVVCLFTSNLTINGVVSADGENGQVSPSFPTGGGGGAAGTVAITASELVGHGLISVSGGSGPFSSTTTNSGGGSGGLIWVTWHAVTFTSNWTGATNINGGIGSVHNNGGLGEILIIPPCPPTTSGLFCEHCKIGYKESSGGVCAPCSPGTFGNLSLSCFPCLPGHANPKEAQHICDECIPGTFSNHSYSIDCTNCGNGTYAKYYGSTVCDICNADTFSRGGLGYCKDCPIGNFSSRGASECKPCKSAPRDSFYFGPGCAYHCIAGYIYPQCVKPFDALISRFGGLSVFLAVVASAVVVIASPFIYCYVSVRRKKKENMLADLRATGWVKDDVEVAPSTSTPLIQVQREVQTESEWIWEIDDSDLNRHVDRIYFTGNNSTVHPLRLSPEVDAPVSLMVSPDEFSLFCSNLTSNNMWLTWETLTIRILRFICYPLYALLLRLRRFFHMFLLFENFQAESHAFLTNHRARALQNTLRFGFSDCYTLAWIDFLAEESQELGIYPIGKPCVPLYIVSAGDGSFFCPFQIDPRDPLVKSLCKYFGPSLFGFLAAFNEHLREMTQGGLNRRDRRNLYSVLSFLHSMNSVGIGIGKDMPLQGLQFRLGVFSSHFRPKPALVLLSGDWVEEDNLLRDEDGCIEITDNLILFPVELPAQPSITKSAFSLIKSFARHFLLFNTTRKLSKLLSSILMWILLICDVSALFIIIVFISQTIPGQFLLFIFILPLTVFIAPVFGFAALVQYSLPIGRYYSSINLLSLVNVFVLIIVGFSSFNQQWLNLAGGVISPLVYLAIKLLEAVWVNIWLAHVAYSSDIAKKHAELEEKFNLLTIAKQSDTWVVRSAMKQALGCRNSVHLTNFLTPVSWHFLPPTYPIV